MHLAKVIKGLCLYLLLATGCLAGDALVVNAMSFNIRYGSARDGGNHWNKRKDLVFDVLLRHAPDVIGVQEALRFQLDEIGARFPEYGEVGVGRDGGTKGEYSAILYNTNRFTVAESGTFWLSDTPDVPSKHWGNACVRICTWARLVDIESKQAFYLFNTHLDHRSQPSREKGVRLIMEKIRQRKHRDPFVLMGDFNADENNPSVKCLKEMKLVDTFRVLYPDAAEVGTFNAFKGQATGGKIDFIFTVSDIRVVKASIIRDNREGRYPSDHFPVTARIQLDDSGLIGEVRDEI